MDKRLKFGVGFGIGGFFFAAAGLIFVIMGNITIGMMMIAIGMMFVVIGAVGARRGEQSADDAPTPKAPDAPGKE
jgi:tetrahydromethanopterin S-methyltransferase subunit E